MCGSRCRYFLVYRGMKNGEKLKKMGYMVTAVMVKDNGQRSVGVGGVEVKVRRREGEERL